MSRIIKTLLALAAVAAIALGAASPAHAEGASVESTDGYIEAGWGIGFFNSDPVGSDPGDAFYVCDTASDGFYVKAYLDIDQDGSYDRSATTKGQKAGYCSPWETGNISEGNQMDFYIYKLYDGEVKAKSPKIEVVA